VVELQTTSAAAKKAAASREDAQPSQEETEKMLELQQTLAHVKNELTESRNVASNEIAGMMERTAAIQAKMSERQQADAAFPLCWCKCVICRPSWRSSGAMPPVSTR